VCVILCELNDRTVAVVQMLVARLLLEGSISGVRGGFAPKGDDVQKRDCGNRSRCLQTRSGSFRGHRAYYGGFSHAR